MWIPAPLTRTVRDTDGTGITTEKVLVTGFKPASVFDAPAACSSGHCSARSFSCSGLTLGILAVMLLRKKRTVVPMVFVLVMTVYALFVQLGTFYDDQDWLLLALDIIILIAALWVIVEALGAVNRARKGLDSDGLDDELEPVQRGGDSQ